MAEIAVKPFVMQECILTVAGTGFSAHVSSVELAPTASTVAWKGLAPGASFTGVGLATWLANLAFAQDWDDEDSLSNYLLENEGLTVPMHFEPVAGGASFDANITITPGSIGGAVDTVGVSTVSLGVSGKPVRNPAPGA